MENGAIINANDNKALNGASKNGHLEVVEYLVVMNPDLFNDLDDALVCASAGGHLDVVKYVLHLCTF